MQNVFPIKTKQTESTVIHATVKSVLIDKIIIETEFGVMSSQVAFSCFIVPEVHDLVLVDCNAGKCYILSVLERSTKKDVNIKYPATVKMHVAKGDLNIISDNDLRFSARGKSTFVSRDASFISNTMNIVANAINNRSEQIESHTKNVRLFSNSIDIVANQIKQRADNIIRWVEGLESTNIGNLIQNVRHSLTSHSTQAVITAKKDLRMDAERIHMG